MKAGLFMALSGKTKLFLGLFFAFDFVILLLVGLYFYEGWAIGEARFKPSLPALSLAQPLGEMVITEESLPKPEQRRFVESCLEYRFEWLSPILQKTTTTDESETASVNTNSTDKASLPSASGVTQCEAASLSLQKIVLISYAKAPTWKKDLKPSLNLPLNPLDELYLYGLDTTPAFELYRRALATTPETVKQAWWPGDKMKGQVLLHLKSSLISEAYGGDVPEGSPTLLLLKGKHAEALQIGNPEGSNPVALTFKFAPDTAKPATKLWLEGSVGKTLPLSRGLQQQDLTLLVDTLQPM
jgi:hypothetical protein